MSTKVAIVGAGVSGLTSAIVLAERGYSPQIFAAEPAEKSTSGAAAAIWYPYEAEPRELALVWGMISYGRLLPLVDVTESGITLIEFRFYSRGEVIVPDSWASAISFRYLGISELLPSYNSGYSMRVPLIDTGLYLDYLRSQLARGSLHYGTHFSRLEEVENTFKLIVNCSGYDASSLVPDPEVTAHRGQIVLVGSLPEPGLPYAFVCTEEPLTYVIPRSHDCVFGGLNDRSSTCREPDPGITKAIVERCSRVLGPTLAKEINVIEARSGLRPNRKSGVRVDTEILSDGRRVIHNYGHAGAGFSLSWGCAHKVAELARLHVRTDA